MRQRINYILYYASERTVRKITNFASQLPLIKTEAELKADNLFFVKHIIIGFNRTASEQKRAL
jgi:hypothetical protein